MTQARLASAEQQLGRKKPGFIADSPFIQQYKTKLAELEVQLVSLPAPSKQDIGDIYAPDMIRLDRCYIT